MESVEPAPTDEELLLPNVAPIFYFNDRPGDRVGLNLFEPRYVLMCSRIERGQSLPHFLFK